MSFHEILKIHEKFMRRGNLVKPEPDKKVDVNS